MRTSYFHRSLYLFCFSFLFSSVLAAETRPPVSPPSHPFLSQSARDWIAESDDQHVTFISTSFCVRAVVLHVSDLPGMYALRLEYLDEEVASGSVRPVSYRPLPLLHFEDERSLAGGASPSTDSVGVWLWVKGRAEEGDTLHIAIGDHSYAAKLLWHSDHPACPDPWWTKG